MRNMKLKQLILLVALTIGFVTKSFSQHQRYAIQNGIGIQGGITQFDIITDNFETKKGTGWLAGASATVDIPHKWYNVSYNIRLSENYLDISGGPIQGVTGEEFIEYKMFAAQIALLLHVKIVKNYFTLDVGPMLQYNGELEIKDKDQENYYLNNFDNLLAQDISDISKFNVNGAVGLSAGYKFFHLKAQYVYGFTNTLSKLNKQDLIESNEKFKGNQSFLVFTAMFSF